MKCGLVLTPVRIELPSSPRRFFSDHNWLDHLLMSLVKFARYSLQEPLHAWLHTLEIGLRLLNRVTSYYWLILQEIRISVIIFLQKACFFAFDVYYLITTLGSYYIYKTNQYHLFILPILLVIAYVKPFFALMVTIGFNWIWLVDWLLVWVHFIRKLILKFLLNIHTLPQIKLCINSFILFTLVNIADTDFII